jgi:hypothetical protein
MPVFAASRRTRGEAATEIRSTLAPERCVTGSKARMSSMSSPKKSSR